MDGKVLLLLLLLAPLGGLAANVLTQIVLSRFSARGTHLRTQFLSIATGAAVTVAGLAALLNGQSPGILDRIGYFILHLMTYLFFAFCFFNVINANVSSLRVRMLREYLAHYPAPLPDAAIYQRYPAREMLAARLARLARGGQVYSRDGRFFLGKRFVMFVGVFFDRLRRLLLPQ